MVAQRWSPAPQGQPWQGQGQWQQPQQPMQPQQQQQYQQEDWGGQGQASWYNEEQFAQQPQHVPPPLQPRQGGAWPQQNAPNAWSGGAQAAGGPQSGTMAVKQELFESGARPGETDREAKRRMMVEKIRAEARQATQEPDASKAPQQEKPKPPVFDKKKEEEDAKKLESMLPILEEKVVGAEDEVEKVAILAAPLSMECIDELQELQLAAIKDTEIAVRSALVTVSAARREVDKRVREAAMMSPSVKQSAEEELAKLTQRLDGAQAKLDEHKTVRKDHEMALAAEKLFGELASRLASVEIDCEKAAMMAEPLAKALDTSPQDINSAEIRETKEALRIAQATLAPTMRLISGKVTGLKGVVRNKMLELQSRAEASQAILDKAQRTVEESQSRVAAVPILKQAAERAAAVEDVLQRMRETEAPFLMGVETIPADEAKEALQRMDKAAGLANSALADAHKYVALKMVDVGRFAEGVAGSAKRELEKVKQQIDQGIERVRKFQAEAAKRKRVNVVEVIKQKIEDAEGAVLKMKELGTELQSAELDKVADILEKAHAAEVEAQSSVTLARRELQDKQQDLRPLEGGADAVKSSSEILRTKVRVNYMEAELTKFRQLVKDFDEKVKVGKSLTDIYGSIKETEQEVERLSGACQSWPTEESMPPEEETHITDAQAKLKSAAAQVETKLQTAHGLELKELRAISGQLQKTQWKLDKVKEAARQLQRSLSMRIVRDAAAAVQKAEGKVTSVSTSASSSDGSISRLETLHEEANAALELVAEAQKALAKGQGPQMMLEAKVEFARLQLRCKAVERKGRAAADAVSIQLDQAAKETVQSALDSLRAAARRADGTYDPDALFKELSEGNAEATEQQFCDFFAKQKAGAGLPAERAQLAFKRIAPHGFTRRVFAARLADFFAVIREITITNEFEIQSAKKVRKLDGGEIVEAIGEPREDSSLGLERVQCRALRDGTAGWVTIRSTSGASYLERASKPFLWCAQSTPMRVAMEEESKQVRTVKAGEVLELVEGPREERLGSDKRVRGVTCHNETTGWLQVCEKSGTVLAKLSGNMHKCSEAIAMTDVADFEKCSMVRRIDAGEALELLPDTEVKPGEGGARRKFRACRDGREGWITTQGSQGTVYVTPAVKHYVCLQASPVHAGLSAESAVVRVLMPGEAFAAFEEPKDVAGGEKLTLYRARAITDGAEGWVVSTGEDEVQAWSSQYRVLKSAPLTRTLAANEAAEVIEVLRLLEPNELLDIVEQPTEDPSTGQLRTRCIAQKDKAVGWVTVREGSGAEALLLRPVTPDEAAGGSGEAAPATPPLATGPRPGKRPFMQVKQEAQDAWNAGGAAGCAGKGGGKRYKGGKGKW